jgi:hypothetical protein
MKRLLRRLSSPGKRPRPTARPAVESLEGRVVPTVVFQPNWPGEYAPLYAGALKSPPVYLIFWGSNWNQTQNTQPYIQATQTLLNSPYLSGLTQYGSDGHANWAAVSADMTSSAPGNFRTSDLQNEVFRVNAYDPNMRFHGSSSMTPIYVVVTDNRATSAQSGAIGYNLTGLASNGTSFTLANLIWVSSVADDTTGAAIDRFTNNLSHELVESITTPPSGPGTVASLPSSLPQKYKPSAGLTQIADGEPQGLNYGYRLNGVWVQPYWSTLDQAFIVPDGNLSTRFTLTPSWSGTTFNKYYSLSAGGDPAGQSTDDLIVIGRGTTRANGTALRVTVNGAAAEFDPGALAATSPGGSAISLDGGKGKNTIEVTSLPAGVSLSIGTTGPGAQDTVVLGYGGTFAKVVGSVSVHNYNGSTSLTVDDSGEAAVSRTIDVQSGSVSLYGLTAVTFGGGVTALTVNGGGGHGGTVRIDSLRDGARATVYPVAGEPVSVQAWRSGAATYLTLDDSADPTGRTFQLSNGAAVVPGLTTVTYAAGLAGLTVSGGPGNDEVDVNGTPAGTTVTVNTGAGADSVNVRAASGPLSVYGRGSNTVVVGNNGSLAGLTGAVSVGSSCYGTASLTIDARNDPARGVTITDHSVSFQGGPTINYVGAATVGGNGVGAVFVETAMSGTKTIAVQSLAAGTDVTVYGEPGDYYFGRLTDRFHFMPYRYFVWGGGGGWW